MLLIWKESIFGPIFQAAGEGYKPEVSLIVCQKRVTARFAIRDNTNKLTNPPPGTVIADQITRVGWYVKKKNNKTFLKKMLPRYFHLYLIKI